MIRNIIYFIISTLFLFFSSSINPDIDINYFHDKNQAIYMMHTNEDTESYSFIQLNRVEVIARNIFKTGIPNSFINFEPECELFLAKEIENLYEIYFVPFYTILDRYETRILRI